MSDYTSYYRKASNLNLFKTLDRPEDYDPEAVSAAKTEFDSRNLSEAELGSLKVQLMLYYDEQNKFGEANQKLQQGLRDKALHFLSSINPLAGDPVKWMNLLLLVYTYFACRSLYYFIYMFSFSIGDVLMGDHVGMHIFNYLRALHMPVALVLLWRRKRLGWVLMTWFLVRAVLMHISMTYSYFVYQANDSIINTSLVQIYSNPGFSWEFMLWYGIDVLALTLMCSKSIRRKFKVGTRGLWMVIIGSLALILAPAWWYYFVVKI